MVLYKSLYGGIFLCPMIQITVSFIQLSDLIFRNDRPIKYLVIFAVGKITGNNGRT